jgi:hypothetical protein
MGDVLRGGAGIALPRRCVAPRGSPGPLGSPKLCGVIDVSRRPFSSMINRPVWAGRTGAVVQSGGLTTTTDARAASTNRPGLKAL